jgi:hypothetical protein
MEHSVTGAIRNLGGQTVYWCSASGNAIAREGDALDLIGETYGREVEWIAVPVSRFSDDFFQLRTGLAGAFLQKLVTYGLRAAIVGDVSREIAASKALADFVKESNRGRHVWFVEDEAALAARLEALPETGPAAGV